MAYPTPSLAQPTPSLAHSTPSLAQPTPSLAHCTPSLAQPTPSLACFTPSLAQPTPSLAQPTPSLTQPTPSLAQPTPSLARSTPSLGHPTPPYVALLSHDVVYSNCRPQPLMISSNRKRICFFNVSRIDTDAVDNADVGSVEKLGINLSTIDNSLGITQS